VNALNARLLAQVYQVAQQLPPPMLMLVANYLSVDVDRALKQLPKAAWRQAVVDLVTLWEIEGQGITGESIAAALLSAQYCIQKNQRELSLEIVWTGPEGSGIPVRRTEQVLLQLIQEAQQELIIVSFAIYKVPELTNALIQSLDRGVQLKLIAETSDDNKVPFGIEAGLGQAVAERAQVYQWDKSQRPRDESGRYGSLHAKVAIADRRKLFITSANLTGYALSLNMEMGLLVHNQELADQVTTHIEKLIESKVLTSLT
jgi:phosphatidylserine/phosphatidylglycerophosphate/cardiolipin synthase-like enzyme